MSERLWLWAAALCAALLLPAGPGRCPAAERPSAEQKIEEELGRPTQLEFVETPLQDVVDFLKRHHKIEIQVDRKALDDVGLDPATIPITKNCKGISLRSALRLILRDLDLAYVIQDDVLLITTPEQAETRLTTRIYAVGDLAASFRLPSGSPWPPDVIPVVGTWSATEEPAEDPARPAETEADPSAGAAPKPTGVPPRPRSLADMISWTIEPNSWEEVGGPGSIAGGSVGGVDVLIVSQTQDVHEQIVDLLETLRKFVRCNQSPAAPAAKPAVPKPPADEPPKTLPPAPTPAVRDPGGSN